MADVLVAGRLNIDLFAQPLRTRLADAHSYERALGGFAGNVATAAARLGLEVGVISRVGDDGHGEFARRFLSEEGVDVSQVSTDPYWPTPIAFVESWPPDRFPITYYRKPTATDLQLTAEHVDWTAVEKAAAICVSGTALVEEPSAGTTIELLARARGLRVFDLDYRASLWPDLDRYRSQVAAAAAHADIVLGNLEELAAAGIAPGTVGTLIEKRGELGAVLHESGSRTELAPYPVEVVNGLGSGDAFCAAVVWGALSGMPLSDAARAASVAGAMVAARETCSTSMPTRAELESTLAAWTPR